MFGEFGPRLKGGWNRIQQVVQSGIMSIKGPSDLDLTIAAGDRSDPTSGAARTLNLAAGSAWTLETLNQNGGAVTITATDARGTGTGGAVTITGGATKSGTGGAISVTAGGHANSGDGNGGAVTITGGAGGANSGAGGDSIIVGGASPGSTSGGNVRLKPGTGTSRNGNILLDGGIGGALATAASGGFVQFPSCAGTPTGVPNSIGTGMIPTIFDSTNQRFYAYIGSTWRSLNAGGSVNSQSVNYTTTLADGGENRVILHPSSDANARTFTIAANSSVAYDVGTVLIFINDSANALSIAINTDTLVFEGAGTTGTRTLAQFGRAVATKIASTRWYITGTNLT